MFVFGEDSLAKYSDTGLVLTILALVSPLLGSLLMLMREGLEVFAKSISCMAQRHHGIPLDLNFKRLSLLGDDGNISQVLGPHL